MVEDEGFVVVVVVIVIGPFDIFEIFDDSWGNCIVKPLVFLQPLQNLIVNDPTILCLKILHPIIIQITIVIYITDTSTAINNFPPVEWWLLIWQWNYNPPQFLFFIKELFKDGVWFLGVAYYFRMEFLLRWDCQIVYN